MARDARRAVRLEVESRDDFWRRALVVEWSHQYPERLLVVEDDRHVIADSEWLVDLERVAKKCFSRVRLAPASPSRRRLFRKMVGEIAG